MKKSILVTSLLVLVVSVSSLGASENFDLRSNMMKLNVELIELQRGLISGNQKKVESILDNFEKDVDDLLGDNLSVSQEIRNTMHRSKMMELLPKDMKNKKHKVSIAMESSRKIETGVRLIREALANKDGLSIQKRHIKAQEAYLDIANACFRCHNLVRDKKRLK